MLISSGCDISRVVIIYCGQSQIVSLTLFTIIGIILKTKFTIQTKQHSPRDYLPITSNANFFHPIFMTCELFCPRGCKHSKLDQPSAPVYKSRGFLGQRPISNSKMLFKIDYFS